MINEAGTLDFGFKAFLIAFLILGVPTQHSAYAHETKGSEVSQALFSIGPVVQKDKEGVCREFLNEAPTSRTVKQSECEAHSGDIVSSKRTLEVAVIDVSEAKAMQLITELCLKFATESDGYSLKAINSISMAGNMAVPPAFRVAAKCVIEW